MTVHRGGQAAAKPLDGTISSSSASSTTKFGRRLILSMPGDGRLFRRNRCRTVHERSWSCIFLIQWRARWLANRWRAGGSSSTAAPCAPTRNRPRRARLGARAIAGFFDDYSRVVHDGGAGGRAGRWRWRRAAWSRPGLRLSIPACTRRARAGAEAARRLHHRAMKCATTTTSAAYYPGLSGPKSACGPRRVTGFAASPRPKQEDAYIGFRHAWLMRHPGETFGQITPLSCGRSSSIHPPHPNGSRERNQPRPAAAGPQGRLENDSPLASFRL